MTHHHLAPPPRSVAPDHAPMLVGIAVADGRPKGIAVESGVTFAFVVVSAAAITGFHGS